MRGVCVCVRIQVAIEVMTDICTEMGVSNPAEVNEFSIFATRGQGKCSRLSNSLSIFFSHVRLYLASLPTM